MPGDDFFDSVRLRREELNEITWPRLTCSGENQTLLEGSRLQFGNQRDGVTSHNWEISSFDGQYRIVFNRQQSALELHDQGALRFFTGGPAPTEKLSILANGNVGIGAISPGTELAVLTETSSNGISHTDGEAVLSTFIGTGNSTTTKGGWLGTLSNHDLRFFTANGPARMTIGTTDNVGIGTLAPAAKLQVVNGAIMPAVGNSSQAGIQFPSNPGGGGGDQAFIRYFRTAGETTKLLIGIDNDPDDTLGFYQMGAERMTVVNGFVSIGVSTPRTPLHVLGRISTGLDFNSAGAVTFFPPDGFAWFHIDNGPAGGRPLGRLRISYGNLPGDFEVVSITQGNRVGINVANPLAQLHVAGPLIASGVTFPSDARLKTNIAPLSGVLEKLAQVRGVSFNWNEQYQVFGEPTGERQIGIIAQEMESVFPEMVTTLGDDCYKAVDYSKLTVLLIEAVRELRAKIGVLAREVEVIQDGSAARLN